MDENLKKEIQSATLERLMSHLDERKDVQNIDLMNLAGFCRNCLSRWYREESIKLNLNISENTEIVLGVRPEHFGPQYENKVSGKITFVETQGREDLYDVSFNNNITIRSIQPSENRVELNSDVNWGIMKEGLLLFDKNGKRL